MIGAGGTFYNTHFRDLPPGSSSLLDTSTRSADAYYNHHFSPRNWTGVTYKFQRMEIGLGSNVTLTHSLLLSHTIYLRQRMTLSFFAGPEYSEIDSVTVTANVALRSFPLPQFQCRASTVGLGWRQLRLAGCAYQHPSRCDPESKRWRRCFGGGRTKTASEVGSAGN